MFNLTSGLKVEWIDTDLPDNTTGWRSEWYHIADQQIKSLVFHVGLAIG
jgi:hypothetical protein